MDALEDLLPYAEDIINDREQLACFKTGVVQRHVKAGNAAIAKARGIKNNSSTVCNVEYTKAFESMVPLDGFDSLTIRGVE